MNIRSNSTGRHGSTGPLARWCLLGCFAMAAMLAGCDNGDITSLPEASGAPPAGVLQNVPVADVTAAGWSLCYSGSYGVTGVPLSSILGGCPGTLMMLACRSSGGANLTLAAFALRSDVTMFVPGSNEGDTTSVHTANGVDWYYSDTGSGAWGFASQGDPVNKNNCDVDTVGTVSPELKMCWHTFNGAIDGGYRCGTIVDFGTGTERLIFVL